MGDRKGFFRKREPKAKGYSEAGASNIRRALKSFTAASGSPNEDINWNNHTLRQRGRMLYMASPVATAAINTNRTKVVGVGLTLKAAVDRDVLGLSPEAAKLWQKKTEAEFRLWASKKENCDALGINNFAGLQQLGLLSWLMSGDVFGLIKRYEPSPANPYTLRLHMIEADRVSTPNEYAGRLSSYSVTDGENKATGFKIYDGVEVDGNGMVVAYHIRSSYPNQASMEENVTWQRVKAYGEATGMPNILHVMSSERCEQYRGVTYLAKAIEPLLQLRRYTESEVMAALVQTFFSAWITTNTNPAEIPINEVGSEDVIGIYRESPEGISKHHNEYEIGPGTINHLSDGETVTFGNPNVPSAGFDQFVRTMCRILGSSLGIPHDVLMKEFNASYSASRAALLEAWEDFKMLRQWFIDDFCQPAYELWLAEAVATGRIKAPGFFTDPLLRNAWSVARWIGPVQGQIDPVKDVTAAIMNVDRGFKTHEQVTRELGGGDWEDNIEQLKDENGKLRDAGGGNFMAALKTPGQGESKEGDE